MRLITIFSLVSKTKPKNLIRSKQSKQLYNFISIVFICCLNLISQVKSNSFKPNFTREEIKIGASTFVSNTFNVQYKQTGSILDTVGEFYLPSDIILNLPSGKSLEILISQGYTNESEYITINFEGKQINSVLDSFGNVSQNGISYYSSNFSPVNMKPDFDNFIEAFASFFQFQASSLLDRTNYINEKGNFFNLQTFTL